MTWVKVDDGLHSHPKWHSIGKGARALWVTALSWCGAQEDGGFVPTHMLRVLGGTPGEARALVDCGLWEAIDGGWAFHEWDAHNPDADSAKAARAAKSSGGRLGNHERWHVARRVKVAGCEWCEGIGNRSDSDRMTESGANPPDPTRPDPIPTTGSSTPTVRRTRASDDESHPQSEFQNVGAVLASHGMSQREATAYIGFLKAGGLRNPAALITKAHRDGSLDDRIDEWRLVRDAQAPATTGRRTTDDRVRDGLALAARLAGGDVIPIRPEIEGA